MKNKKNKVKNLSESKRLERLLEENKKLKEENKALKKKIFDDGKAAAKTIEKLKDMKGVNLKDLDKIEGYTAKLVYLVLKMAELYEAEKERLKNETRKHYGRKSERSNTQYDNKPKKKREASYTSFIKLAKNLAGLAVKELDVDFEALGLNRDDYVENGYDEILKVEGNIIESSTTLVKKKSYIRKERHDSNYEEAKIKGKTPILSMPQYVTAKYEDPFPNSIATPSFTALVLALKYDFGIPYSRLASKITICGLPIREQTISNIGSKGIELLSPLEPLITKRVLDSKYIHADETTLKVIKSENTKNYVYVFSTCKYSAPAVWYKYTGTRSFKANEEEFKDFKGWIMCDGFPGYPSFADSTDGKVQISGCNGHCRRKFNDAYTVLPEDSKKNSKSKKVLDAYAVLYAKETKIKLCTPEERLKVRQSKGYQNAVTRLKKAVKRCKKGLVEGSLLEDAVNYFYNHEDVLFAYLTDGHLEIDNNEAERKVKDLIIPRNNFLFVRNNETAKDLEIIMSVIQTAKVCGLKAKEYLQWYFSNYLKHKDDIEKIAPWSSEIPDEIRMSL